jgi:hypothetical protein
MSRVNVPDVFAYLLHVPVSTIDAYVGVYHGHLRGEHHTVGENWTVEEVKVCPSTETRNVPEVTVYRVMYMGLPGEFAGPLLCFAPPASPRA